MWEKIVSIFTSPVTVVKDSLGAILGGILTLTDSLVKFLVPFLQKISDGVIALCVLVLAVVRVVGSFFESLPGWLSSLYDYLDSIWGWFEANTLGALPAALQPSAAFFNYMLPITELLILTTLVGGLFIVSAAIRAVKGWIPFFYGS